MSVFCLIPVHQDQIAMATATAAVWKAKGYGVAALVDGPRDEIDVPQGCDLVVQVDQYKGFASSINTLCAELQKRVGDVDWVVVGNADIYPHEGLTAEQIAAQCKEHFDGTLGVMQPAGQHFGALAAKTACTCAWIGLEWRQTFYGGKGPFHPEYFHYYEDAEIMHVASLTKTLWWRTDLTQHHDHYLLHTKTTPPHLEKTKPHAVISKNLFMRRKAQLFPGAIPEGFPIELPPAPVPPAPPVRRVRKPGHIISR